MNEMEQKHRHANHKWTGKKNNILVQSPINKLLNHSLHGAVLSEKGRYENHPNFDPRAFAAISHRGGVAEIDTGYNPPHTG